MRGISSVLLQRVVLGWGSTKSQEINVETLGTKAKKGNAPVQSDAAKNIVAVEAKDVDMKSEEKAATKAGKAPQSEEQGEAATKAPKAEGKTEDSAGKAPHQSEDYGAGHVGEPLAILLYSMPANSHS